jgi:BirA family transcriptional regulator, biotin operon repressor / biotin---[acetyl-CoA-carboxylase] ligase
VDASQALLDLLRSQTGRDWTETEIASRLGWPNAQVQDQIRELQSAGYSIGSLPQQGIRLLEAPDRLLPEEIRSGLHTRRFGWRAHCFFETTSTNDVALELAAQGAPEGTLVVAENQTQGRGRNRRVWNSPPGENLLFSLILRPPWPADHASLITLLAAVAVARAVRIDAQTPALIKWPNDVYIHNAKVAGVLTEMKTQGERVQSMVCGIGLNVNAVPSGSELRQPAMCLAEAAGKRLSRVVVLRRVLEEFENLYQHTLEQGRVFLLRQYAPLSWLDGRTVTIELSAQDRLEGTVLGIDETGALLVRLEGGLTRRVASGEVNVVGQRSASRP